MVSFCSTRFCSLLAGQGSVGCPWEHMIRISERSIQPGSTYLFHSISGYVLVSEIFIRIHLSTFSHVHWIRFQSITAENFERSLNRGSMDTIFQCYDGYYGFRNASA